MTKILVIDDDRSVRHIVTRGLEGHHDFEVLAAADGETGLQILESENPQVLLLDVFLPEYNGLELFRKIRIMDSKLPVIFITGDTASETAIEAMRAGAYDYLAKPLNIEQLRDLTFSAAKARKMMDQPVALPIGDGDVSGERFVGNAKSMIEVFKDIGRVAAQNVTVLVRGESGSGKELVARALVQHSDRADQPFVAVNCAAIPDQLLESELFGHEKGAFTGAEKRRVGRFEKCTGGTIFLDEIGDMSPVTQGKVLRILQEQKFERVGGDDLIKTDVRIIAATNRPLEDMVDNGDFRKDLLYRLNGFTIHLPPLRERREDIPLLLEYFLRRAKSEMNRPELTGVTPQALQCLSNYSWPGNIRQLQSVIRQSLLNTTGTVVDETNLPGFVSELSSSGTDDPAATECSLEELQNPNATTDVSRRPKSVEQSGTLREDGAKLDHDADTFSLPQFIDNRLAENSRDLYAETLEQVERRLFAKVLNATEGNQSKAAEILGITRGKVRDRIATFGIQVDRVVSLGD